MNNKTNVVFSYIYVRKFCIITNIIGCVNRKRTRSRKRYLDPTGDFNKGNSNWLKEISK